MRTNEPTTPLRAPFGVTCGVTSVTFDRDDRLALVTIGSVQYDVAGLAPETVRQIIYSPMSAHRVALGARVVGR
jgi:hypothetical protein